jgi:hypothetical protein
MRPPVFRRSTAPPRRIGLVQHIFRRWGRFREVSFKFGCSELDLRGTPQLPKPSCLLFMLQKPAVTLKTRVLPIFVDVRVAPSGPEQGSKGN